MKRFVVANWKSNKTTASVAEWLQDFGTAAVPDSLEVIVAASHTLLPYLHSKNVPQIKLAAQDVSPLPMGSYTGAVAAGQLAEFGISYCLVGHSERREYFHESDADVAKKITELLQVGITPILCLDEPYIASQARVLSEEERAQVLILYEQKSAIGSGHPTSVGQVEKVVQSIRTFFQTAPILYGGSVDERTCQEFLLVTDGVGVGTASLSGKQFAQIVSACSPD